MTVSQTCLLKKVLFEVNILFADSVTTKGINWMGFFYSNVNSDIW